jgi:hypothetical protein
MVNPYGSDESSNIDIGLENGVSRERLDCIYRA